MNSEFPLVQEAHDQNAKTLERLYIDRRFKNDTVRVAFPKGNRLEKLFDLYTKMTAQQTPSKKATKRQTKGGK